MELFEKLGEAVLKLKDNKRILAVFILLVVLAGVAAWKITDENSNEAVVDSASKISPAIDTKTSQPNIEDFKKITKSSAIEAEPPISNIEDFREYLDLRSGVRIFYPMNWSRQNIRGRSQTIQPISFFLSPLESSEDNYQELVQLVIEYLPNESITLDEYFRIAKENLLNRFPDTKISELSHYTTKIGIPVSKVEYSNQEEGMAFKVMKVTAIRDSKAYHFTYIAEADSYDKFLGEVQVMVDSLEFIEVQ